MARLPRGDSPGTWHHVINRGLAKRPLFETRADIRYFVSRLAREVRSGRIEVHAWCVLTTHFHLLVRSPVGELSEAMRLVQNAYSRWFNRRAKRDGTLIRGRFFSKPVTSLQYRVQLVRYIDANPVGARLARSADQYAHGSARQYVHELGPRWLARGWVESAVRAHSASGEYDGPGYLELFGGGERLAVQELVEARVRGRGLVDDLDDLIGAAPDRVRDWMQRKAALADGTKIGQPVCARGSVCSVLAASRAWTPTWGVSSGEVLQSAWLPAGAGLLRTLAGLRWTEIAAALDTSHSRAHRAWQRHTDWMQNDPGYADRVAQLSAEALHRTYGAAHLPTAERDVCTGHNPATPV